MNPPIISSLFCIRTREKKDSRCGKALVARMDEEIGSYKSEENNGNYAVHGEEGGIEFAQVPSGNQRMLVQQQKGNSGEPGQGNLSPTKYWKQRDQQAPHQQGKQTD